MLKTLIASALVLTVASPVKAQLTPGLGSTDFRDIIALSSSSDRQYARVCTNDQNGRLSMRTGPGQHFRKIKEIPNRHAVSFVKGKYDSQGFYWLNVVHNRTKGWVRADYVCRNL